MAQPLRAGELTNLVRIHRPTDALDEYGDTPAGFEPTRGPVWMSIRPEVGGLRTGAGPGEQPVKAAVARARAPLDVQERDVLEVYAGPEAGAWYETPAVFRPDSTQVEMHLQGYTGERPAS
jgi:hypothetical protein